MAERPRGMGRGLAAILTATAPAGTDPGPASGDLRQIPVELISPNPNQPRSRFDPDARAVGGHVHRTRCGAEHQQRIAHGAPPGRQRRWNDTVSTTSSTTDTMFAISAPPDRETTLAVASRVRPSVET